MTMSSESDNEEFWLDSMASNVDKKAEVPSESQQAFDDDVELPEIHPSSSSEDDYKENRLLPPEAKKALVYLYRNGTVLLYNDPERFHLLCKYEDIVRKHMDAVYMEVVFDKKSGHIFTQVTEPDDDEDIARLVSAKPLSLYQSYLLLVIRRHYQEREAIGEQHIVLDLERLSQLMIPYLDISNSTKRDSERLTNSLKALVDKKLLIKIKGEDNRYQISPIIRNVVNAEFLEDLLAQYERMLKLEGGFCGSEDDPDDD